MPWLLARRKKKRLPLLLLKQPLLLLTQPHQSLRLLTLPLLRLLTLLLLRPLTLLLPLRTLLLLHPLLLRPLRKPLRPLLLPSNSFSAAVFGRHPAQPPFRAVLFFWGRL
ncbi:hypothetical protein FHS02_005169 [Massilia umbonata]|uniref:Uncharacterized protein n=1 Tax=Pseudoduganella umbonata TaxID=864828 RepID=A0A7W5HD72_9BURK|nr:hypothetical protein [Pseudoduganella umbonata]